MYDRTARRAAVLAATLAAICSGCGPACSQYRDLHDTMAAPPYDATWESPGVAVLDLSYSDFLSRVDKNEVRQVAFTGDAAFGELTDGRRFRAVTPDDPSLTRRLIDHHVEVSVTPTDTISVLVARLLVGSMLGVMVVGFAMYFASPGQGDERTVPFGSSRARSLTKAARRTTFEDVAGIDEAVQDLRDIVEFLRDPAKFQRLGGRIPRGVLLVGPPGTGKTLIARAVAGEADVPFFIISGSDFVEKFAGVGASRVRDMFDQARKNAPCIIFIDEIDAVGRRRGTGLGGGTEEREQTLNQLLVEMDGFEVNDGIILIAATNRPDILDPALLRPGRFNRHVVVPNPDVMGREAILKVHVRRVPLASDVKLEAVARGTPGFSGADLMNLVNEAALMAARRNRCSVTQREFEDAKDKAMMGAQRRSLALTDEDKMLTAYHEGGHAIVALHVKASDPIYKATIVPRGRALGMVMQLPESDLRPVRLEQMKSRLDVLMGGRAAEELVFGREKVTSGAEQDIEQATRLARMMVTQWGLSEELGAVAYGDDPEPAFLAHSTAHTRNISAMTAQRIDSAIRRLVEASYRQAHDILAAHHNELELLAKALLEFETLSGDEIKDLLASAHPAREQSGAGAFPFCSEREIQS